jgi:hypothetical protein
LTLGDYEGALIGAVRGQFARGLLGGVYFVEIMDSPAYPARRASFDSKIWILFQERPSQRVGPN